MTELFGISVEGWWAVSANLNLVCLIMVLTITWQYLLDKQYVSMFLWMLLFVAFMWVSISWPVDEPITINGRAIVEWPLMTITWKLGLIFVAGWKIIHRRNTVYHNDKGSQS